MRNKPIRVTPKLATKWLQKNVTNRPLSLVTVERYAKAMSSGEWQLNGDTIRFDDSGNLIDGQHRLHACVKSGKAFHCYLVTGLPAEAFDTIEQGMPRTLAHVLARRGEKSYCILASAIRWVWLIENDRMGRQAEKLRPAVMDEVLEANPGLREAVSATTAMTGARARSVIPQSSIAALYYLFGESKPQKNRDFWERVIEGTGLTKDMPEYVLRKRLLTNATAQAKLPYEAVFAIVIKTWNAASQNKPLKNLQWRPGEDFPKIAGTEYPKLAESA